MENHKIELTKMKLKYELDARKQAEEFNEFKARYSRDFDALIERHSEEITAMKKQHEEEMLQKQVEHNTNYTLLHNLSHFKENIFNKELDDRDQQLQEEYVKHVQRENELREKYEKDMNDLKLKHKNKCTIC